MIYLIQTNLNVFYCVAQLISPNNINSLSRQPIQTLVFPLPAQIFISLSPWEFNVSIMLPICQPNFPKDSFTKKKLPPLSRSLFRLDNQIRNKFDRLVQIRHSQHWFIFAIDTLLKASDSRASATSVPQVADQVEETHHKVETGQPRTRRSEVKRVNFGRHTAHRVQRTQRSVSHVLSRAASLPRLNVILDFVQVQTVSTAQGLQPRALEIPETHRFTAENDFASRRAHQVFTQTGGALCRTDVSTQALVADQEGQSLRLRSFRARRAVEFAGVSSVVEPDKAASDESHQGQSAQAVRQVSFARPDYGATSPAERLGQNVPSTASDTNQAKPDVTADDVFHVVDADNPAFATKRRANQVAKNHSRVQSGVSNDPHVAAAWSPSVIDTAEEHGFSYQQQSATSQQNQVVADDVGHLVLIFPVVAEERRVFFENFRAANGVINAAQTENSRGNQVKNADYEEGEDSRNFTAGADAPTQSSDVGHQD